MEETIHGTVMPVLELTLQPGESVVSEVGEFSWMTDAITFTTNMGGGMGGKGVMGALKRAVGGGVHPDDDLDRARRGGLHLVRRQAARPHRAHRCRPRATTTWSTAMGSWRRRPASNSASASSNRCGAASSAAWASCSRRSAARAGPSSTSQARCWPSTSSPGRACGCTRATSGSSSRPSRSPIERVPGLVNRYMGDDGHHFAVMNGPGRIWLQSMPLPILAGSLGRTCRTGATPAAPWRAAP